MMTVKDKLVFCVFILLCYSVLFECAAEYNCGNIGLIILGALVFSYCGDVKNVK